MAYHVSLINTESKNQSIKLIRNRDEFRNFLIKEFDMVEEFDKEGNLQLYYDKNDPEFTIFYTEGIEGEYYINTTEDRYIEKLISIARKLNDGTRVRGDEGETYLSLEKVYIHPDDENLFSSNVNSGESFFKSPYIRIGIIIGVIVCLIQILLFKI